MLNISPHKVNKYFSGKNIKILKEVEAKKSGKVLLRLIIGFSIIFLIFLFLPWTQNIRATGKVTTLYPDKRPQTIHSIIGGRIEKWYVREGDVVRQGDTIMFISETKDAYFNPDLIDRTADQLEAKKQSVNSYREKTSSLESQIKSLKETQRLKISQAKNSLKQARLKATSDSIDYEAAKIDFDIAKQQYERFEKLYEQGLKSKTELENRKNTLQRSRASTVASENRLLTSQNQVINAQVELISLKAQYDNQISKAESEKFTAMSSMYDAESMVNKLSNDLSNYQIRSGMYYITAPIKGFVTQTLQSGIGETIKEGERIVSIMPYEFEFAVEMFVRPIDLPLVKLEQKVRIQFDGWPAIVFSGWPNTSYGTYGGRIFAIDNIIQPDGTYRVLVAPDEDEEPWPDALRVGAGSNSILLLQDVPIWYEMWRQFNGFPPDYYAGDTYIYPGDRTKKK